MNAVTHKVVVRKDLVNAAGTSPLQLQAFINGSRVMIPLSIRVQVKLFDKDRQMVKAAHPDALVINQNLNDVTTRVLEVMTQANKERLILTRETFRNRFNAGLGDDFNNFWRWDIERRRQTLKPVTYKGVKARLEKFARYRPHISFTEITPALLADFDSYMQRQGNKVNTRRVVLATIKAALNRARNEGVTVGDPFKKYKMPPWAFTREALSMEHTQLLIALYDSKVLEEATQESLLYFLVSCFSGMRVSDAIALGPEMMSTGKLVFTPKKTDKMEKVLTITPSKVLMRFIDDALRHIKKAGKIKSEQKINKHLKRVAAICEIDTNLHMHIARHTFATNWLRNGGSKETLQQVLGHSSIRTTEIYTHMIDERVADDMKLFDTKFK
jgi:site-specific recombinase XerD